MELYDSNAELVYMISTERSCIIKVQLTIICIKETNLTNNTASNIALKSYSVHCYSTSQEESTSAMDTSTTSIQPNTGITHAEMTTQPVCKRQVAGSVASIGLGILVGVLVVLLALVTIGWMWTCWIVKKRARTTTNSRDIT
jgi:cobalamin biosynthesis Mg chelatase CobN